MVGAYITDVETSEESAARGRRCQRAGSAAQSSRRTNRRPPCFPTTRSRAAEAPADMFRATEGRWGSREIEITEVKLRRSGRRAPGTSFIVANALDVRLRMRAPLRDRGFRHRHRDLQRRRRLLLRHQHQHRAAQARANLRRRGSDVHIDSLDLVEGTYKLDVAIHKLDGYPYDYHRLLYTFRVKSRTKDVGIYRPEHAWPFSDGMKFDA